MTEVHLEWLSGKFTRFDDAIKSVSAAQYYFIPSPKLGVVKLQKEIILQMDHWKLLKGTLDASEETFKFVKTWKIEEVVAQMKEVNDSTW